MFLRREAEKAARDCGEPGCQAGDCVMSGRRVEDWIAVFLRKLGRRWRLSGRQKRVGYRREAGWRAGWGGGGSEISGREEGVSVVVGECEADSRDGQRESGVVLCVHGIDGRDGCL